MVQKQWSLKEVMKGKYEAEEQARQVLEKDDGTLDPILKRFYEEMLESASEETVRLLEGRV